MTTGFGENTRPEPVANRTRLTACSTRPLSASTTTLQSPGPYENSTCTAHARRALVPDGKATRVAAAVEPAGAPVRASAIPRARSAVTAYAPASVVAGRANVRCTEVSKPSPPFEYV